MECAQNWGKMQAGYHYEIRSRELINAPENWAKGALLGLLGSDNAKFGRGSAQAWQVDASQSRYSQALRMKKNAQRAVARSVEFEEG